MKHRFFRLFTILMVCSSISYVSAYGYRYEKEADVLYKLGLYSGISEKAYMPDLGSNLTREQAAVILINLFGEQDYSNKMTNSKVNKVLNNIKDAEDISKWAKKQVAYAISQGYIKGIEKDNEIYFNPQGYVKGVDYASLILQKLKITDFEYNKAIERLKQEGILSKESNFSKNEMSRDEVIGMSYGALKAKIDDEKTVIENLIDLGKVKREDAEKFGLIKKKDEVIDTKEEVKDQEDTSKNSNQDVIKEEENKINNNNEKEEENNVNDNTVNEYNEEKDWNNTNVKNLKRAEGAVKLGQWTLSNRSRESLSINKIYLSAEYGGNPFVLEPAHVTEYSIEDTNGNVYATFSSLSNTRQVNLQKPFVVDEMENSLDSQKDIVVYAKINENATYGGTIELFLGDGINLFEGVGKITGTSIIKTGDRIEQEDGKITVVMSEVLPKLASYNTNPIKGSHVTVGVFELANNGSKGVLMEKITLKERINTNNNSNYILRNQKGDVISQATSDDKYVIFEINGGQKISAGKSERFEVQIVDQLEEHDRVQLRLEKEGTSYDTLDNKGYEMNIDDDLTFDEVVVTD